VNQGGAWVFYEGNWHPALPPSPTVVYEPAPSPREVVAEVAPPQELVEVRPRAPFVGAVWIAGYWTWQAGRHVWVGGRWSAPRRGCRWQPHRWERTGKGGWRMVPGRWVAG
jgi:hypothetical protein